jgi:predicted site-specific integrase-resolvase
VTATLLRPRAAADRFGVSARTLARWAASRLIGRSQVDGIVFYDAGDIADVIERNVVPRTVVPMTTTTSRAQVDDADTEAFWSRGAR